MYDDNEQIENLRQVANDAIRIASSIYRYANQLKDRKVADALNRARNELLNPDKEFVFTGQLGDLRYFQQSSFMPIDFVENIPDDTLRAAVKEQFNLAARQGFLVIDPDSQMIAVTDKGRAYINSKNMQEVFSNTIESVKETSDMGFVLTGTQDDLQVFNHVDEIKLSDIINKGSAKQGENVIANFKELSNKGFVSINQNAVKITESGIKMLKSGLLKGAEGKLLATGALGTVGAVIVVVKKAADVAKVLFTTSANSK